MRPPFDEDSAASSAGRSARAGNIAVVCPICGAPSAFFFAHPEADIHHCPECTHAFSRLDSVRAFETYDASYNAEHQSWYANPNTPLFHWIDEHLPADCRAVLDVGCGNGDFLKYLQQRRPGCRLVGIDLSTSAPLPGIERLQGDIATQAIPGGFDVVTSLASIEHVADVLAFARRLATLCAPGGRVVVMTLNANSLLYVAARTGRRVGVEIASTRLYSRHHLQHFTPSSLRRLLEAVGLVVTVTHHHNVPLAALDLPGGWAIHTLLKAAVAMCFGLGRLTNRCYLQTVVCRRGV